MFQATNKASLFRLSPAIKRHLAVSVPLVTSLLLPSTVFMLVSLNLEGKLSDSSPWHWPRVVNFGKQHLALDQAMPRILVSGAQSAVLYFVNRVYSKYSYAITKWEGWHTEEEFGGSLALKRLPFELATMLISPLIHVVWGADPLTLRHELIGIMLGDTASRLLTEVAWPVLYAYFISKYAVPAKQRTADAATDADRAMATRVLRESQLPKLEFFDCYCFLIRYYIIATCFASVFPLGTVLITAILYSEAKICVFLMTRCRQRIPSMRATSIGIWFDVLRFVSALCITCNVILQAHTTTQLTANFGHTALIATAGAFGAGFAVEQILRLVGWLISVLVPDVPPRVRDSGKGREKKEAAKRRWADIHSSTAKTEGGTGATQATRRAAVAEMSARGDLLPSLQG